MSMQRILIFHQFMYHFRREAIHTICLHDSLFIWINRIKLRLNFTRCGSYRGQEFIRRLYFSIWYTSSKLISRDRVGMWCYYFSEFLWSPVLVHLSRYVSEWALHTEYVFFIAHFESIESIQLTDIQCIRRRHFVICVYYTRAPLLHLYNTYSALRRWKICAQNDASTTAIRNKFYPRAC